MEIGTTIKPDGGCIKHAESSQTIDRRIQFGRSSPVRVRVRVRLGLGLGLGLGLK